MSDDVANDRGDAGLATLGVGRDDPLEDVRREVPGSGDHEEGTDTLVLGPVWSEADDRICAERLSRARADVTNLLLVTLTESADDRVAHLREHLVDLPDRIAVVSAADEHPSKMAVLTDRGETTVSIDVVDDPSDLPRLGMSIQSAANDLGDGRPTLACFHSLTALLQYVDTQRVFRFLHILQNAVDARTHFHMDADSHDERTVRTLRPLFDTVVEFGEGARFPTE